MMKPTSRILCYFASAALFASMNTSLFAEEAPRLVQKDGRYALLVDGKPFLMLGGQIHNSSAWPAEMPQVMQSLESLHANTIEAPVYWEQMEPEQGRFDFTNVDSLLNAAREHHLRVILLWFGTWKNGQMHYVPTWIKTDTSRFPRVIREDGVPIDVLSANSRANLEADKAAFVALMMHLKQVDSDAHTVIAVQVENESGNVGAIRDNGPQANALFAGPVPADLLGIVRKAPGTWTQVFGHDASEIFQAYYQAHYINEIASAGKAAFSIPLYINVWLSYPPAELPERRMPMPGIQYPSGGAVQSLVGLWRALAPAVDLIGPDIYSDNSAFYQQVLNAYHRPDNALMIPETGRNDSFAKFLFYALGDGAIGFSPFGVDQKGWNILGNETPAAHAYNFALLGPMQRELAQWNFDGNLMTSVEEAGDAQQEMNFGKWQATTAFGFPQRDGIPPPGTKDMHGVALAAKLGPDEFIVTGIDASISFHRPGQLPGQRMQILSAEEGYFENGIWKRVRLWNGDETDRGLSFPHGEKTWVRVKLGEF
jgi:beta-galactosidase GanA